jgi:hypothetical protein
VRRHEEPGLPEPAKTCLAVTRRGYVVRHFELSTPAHQLLHALLAGEPLGQAISWAVEVADADHEAFAGDLRSWFHEWAAEGFFSAVEIAG